MSACPSVRPSVSRAIVMARVRYLGKIHSQAHLGQQVGDDAAVLIHTVDCAKGDDTVQLSITFNASSKQLSREKRLHIET